MSIIEQDALLTHLQKHHIRELENIIADIATLTIKPVTITWNCGLGSITITTKKAQEILNKHSQTLEQAAEEAALKLYPKEETIMYHSAFGKLEFDKNAGQREAFMEGFRYGAKWIAEQIKGGNK